MNKSVDGLQSKTSSKDSLLLRLIYVIFLVQVVVCIWTMIMQPENASLEGQVHATIGSGVFYLSSRILDRSFSRWKRFIALGIMLGSIHYAFQDSAWAKPYLDRLLRVWFEVFGITLWLAIDYPPETAAEDKEWLRTRQELIGVAFWIGGSYLPKMSEAIEWWNRP